MPILHPLRRRNGTEVAGTTEASGYQNVQLIDNDVEANGEFEVASSRLGIASEKRVARRTLTRRRWTKVEIREAPRCGREAWREVHRT